MKITKGTVLSNLIWRYAERFGAQIVTFIVTIVLARLLEPELYGAVALVNVFIVILQVFVDSGLGNALVQKKDADDLDFSTVFYANISFCVLLYVLLYCSAPFIAQFYNNNTLVPVIRVLGLIIVVSGLKNVQQAYVSRNLLFKKFFFSTLGGTLVAAFVGIFLAIKGFGIWALVAQYLLNAVIDTAILWITVNWKPKRLFSFSRLKRMFSYGWKLLATSLVNTIYDNVRSLIIGRKYSSSDLAYYNKGHQFPNLVVTNINTSLDSVLFPAMSTEQDNPVRVKEILRKSITVSTYVLAPLMIGLATTAPTVIHLLLTDKWLPCVPFLRIFCITYMFYPIHTGNLNSIKALGRSDLVLKQEIAKKTVGFSLLFISMWFGVLAMAYSMLVSSLCNQIINSWPNKKLLGYRYLEQIKDILPTLMLAAIMGICVLLIQLVSFRPILMLLLQIIVGGIIYIGGSVITKNEPFYYLIDLFKDFKKKRAN